jgi:hypothetical protein
MRRKLNLLDDYGDIADHRSGFDRNMGGFERTRLSYTNSASARLNLVFAG